MTDRALERLSDRFEEMYSWTGRPSIPPEKLLRALLLQVLYTIRSECLLMEQLGGNFVPCRANPGLITTSAGQEPEPWGLRPARELA